MTSILLPVPYDYQRDNWGNAFAPDRQCQCSANYMTAEYVTDGYVSERANLNGMSQPVDWWAYHVSERGDTTNGLAHSRVWEEMLGIPSCIKKDGSLDDVINMLKTGLPVCLGLHYKGSGHWVTAIGVDIPNRMFRVHDPYGSRAGDEDRYLDTSNEAGKADYYSFGLMKKVWSCSEYQYQRRQEGEGHGWYRWLPNTVDSPE